jgi:segregation and condensation protein A
LLGLFFVSRGAILPPVPITFQTAQFEGPLDLLLQLVEKEELEISEVSLAIVADQFVQYVKEGQGKIAPEELADFLVIAAKLVYMKSKLLLPSLVDDALEEGPDLATQLRLYQQFVAASRTVNGMWESDQVSFPRERRTVRQLEPSFVPPRDLTTTAMRELMQAVITRLTPIIKLPQAAMQRVMTIQDKIASLAQKLRTHASFRFSSVLRQAKDKGERVVSFLALLELVKQRVVKVAQTDLFDDIDVAAHELDRLADLQLEFV